MEQALTTSITGERKKSRNLACQSCRKRRRKCDMHTPCSACVKVGIKCVFLDQDLRRNRHTVAYVTTLESHIGKLECILKKVKDTSDEIERTRLLSSISTDDIVTQFSDTTNNIDTKKDVKPLPKDIDVKLKDNVLASTPNNPTFRKENDISTPISKITNITNSSSVRSSSIYPSNSLSITQKNNAQSSFNSPKSQELQMKFQNLSRSPLILRSLSLFFKWLYPSHFTFIHRETFLSAFFSDPSTKAYYCSQELVFAIAALGATLDDKASDLYTFTNSYYQRSKSIVLKKLFQLSEDGELNSSTSSSKLAIIQTLLCLAFYDIGKGENSTAWYLSGLAFRLVHEIGLHLDPKAWNDVYEDELSKIDFEVRSRIYWGCYMADHLISILFGRSTSLRLSNSTVPETDELPEIESGIEDYVFSTKARLSPASVLRGMLVLSRMTELFARKIFAQSIEIDDRTESLNRFNLEAISWRKDLPEEFRWSKESLLNLEEFNPTLAYVWYHYYIIMISYNKPFLEDNTQSKNIIEENIYELYLLLQLWKKNYRTFEKCSLYMVYSSILAIQCMKTDLIDNKTISEFKHFLESPTLQQDLGKKFIDNDKTADSADLFGTLSHGNDFALEYNFDFTLLNEIDNLIASSENVFPKDK